MDKIYRFLLSAALLLCCITLNAQQPTGDGSQANPYQIATSDNLVWFAGHVNSGNTSACAMLTTDIVVNSGVLNDDGTLNGTPQNIWTPIGGFNGGGQRLLRRVQRQRPHHQRAVFQRWNQEERGTLRQGY